MISDLPLGSLLLIAMLGMAVSMALIPLLIKVAPNIGMVDKPDERKVHTMPIPRVGGIGIVLGALVPMLIWLPFNDITISYIAGSAILLLFGAWDDTTELGHYVKFIGQFIAVLIVVYYGDLWVSHFPFIGLETLPAWIGKPFTVIAIVGVINAINHSDGLDGLAGGESLLSLGAMAYLAYLYDGSVLLIIAFATIGGIFGFLRYNSHPARVFMGDGGSQFLGFTLGFLVVYLTQVTNPVLSPALPVLLLGLPVADILAVFFLRAKAGVNLFRASKNHIHHRLLELGFQHYESVMIIYSIQAGFVITAILFPYENDFFIMGLYLAAVALIFASLTFAERAGFRIHTDVAVSSVTKQTGLPPWLLKLSNIPGVAVESGVSLMLVGAALMAGDVPEDFGVASVLLLVVLGFLLLGRRRGLLLPYRLVAFVTAGFAVYLLSSYPPGWLFEKHAIVYLFFGLLTMATFLTARLLPGDAFQVTPLDYLVVIATLGIALVPESALEIDSIMMMAIQMIILFYASEMVIQTIGSIYNRFTGSLVASLVIISLRAFL